ncbi:MAG: esterase-like activity of phytase family protein [Alphaproteobacteria bacterium]|nr:esterase-like activity of phytase family protein [Alphaproteobacteria bacterium]
MATVSRVALALLAICSVAISACADEAARPLTIKSSTRPLNTGDEPAKSIGKLVHRGTLRLESPDKDFGGLSGLIVAADGERFLAITDSSHWLTGKLSYRDGRLAGVSGTDIGPLLDPDGHALVGKGGDAEGLTGSIDGDVYVSFEGNHRIWRYAFGAQGLAAHAKPVATPAALAQAPHNSGLEGLELLADGRLLALSEAYLDAAENYRGWLIAPDGRANPQDLALRPRMPFALTDVRQLANGDVLTLERRFNKIGGVGFQMRRIAGSSVAEGAVLDGEVVAEAGMNFIIDNMEGLSVRTGADGETLIYLVSDDNFNVPLQQTLLMMFELKD